MEQKKAKTGQNAPSSLTIYLYHHNHIFLFLLLEFLLIVASVRTCLVTSNKILTVQTGMMSLKEKSEDTRFHAGSQHNSIIALDWFFLDPLGLP